LKEVEKKKKIKGSCSVKKKRVRLIEKVRN